MQSLSGEAHSFLASQYISCILWNTTVVNILTTPRHLVHVPYQMSPVNDLTLYSFEIYFNIILQLTASSSKWSLPLRLLPHPEAYQMKNSHRANLKNHIVQFYFKQNAPNAAMCCWVPSEIKFCNWIPRILFCWFLFRAGIYWIMKHLLERSVLLDCRSGMECSGVLLAVLCKCFTAKGPFNGYVKVVVSCYTLWDKLEVCNSNTISQGYSTATIYPRGNDPWMNFIWVPPFPSVEWSLCV
jgi:hypothetical protein